MDVIGVFDVNEYARDRREFRFAGDEVRIGRDPLSDIVLGDVAASRNHARVIRDAAGRLVIKDRGSRNGTFVNGDRLPTGQSRPLVDGDEILVGRSLLRLVLVQEASNRARHGTGGGLTYPESPSGRDRVRTVRLLRGDGLVARLIVCAAGSPASTFELERDESLIGRAYDADVVIPDDSLSEYHAEIIYTKDGFHLVDRGSSRRTRVDGAAVRVAKLSNHSYVQLGNLKALFLIEKVGVRAPAASFPERDRLIDLFPHRATAIHDAFRRSRLEGTDFAATLLCTGILDAEQWWRAAAGAIVSATRVRKPSWLARLLGGSDGTAKRRHP